MKELRWIKADNEFLGIVVIAVMILFHQAIIHSKSNGKDPSFIGDVISTMRLVLLRQLKKVKAETSFDYRPSNPLGNYVF